MHLSRITVSVLFASLFCLLANPAKAQWVQQQVFLTPCWNSVFLEVDPSPNDCDAVFAGLPIESVWDWNPSDSTQYVQDPSTLLPGAPGWLTWYPASHSLAGQGRLFALRDGRPY